MTLTQLLAAQPSDPSRSSSPALRILQRHMLAARRQATSASLAPFVRPVTADVSCGTHPGKRYWADCYRRASDYLLAHTPGQGTCPPIDGIRLVHGYCADDRARWAHAWVDLPGPPGPLVFDGVRQQFYDRDGYRNVLRAVAEVTYDAAGMTERMRLSGRYGPWHAGILGRNATHRLPIRPDLPIPAVAVAVPASAAESLPPRPAPPDSASRLKPRR